MRNPDIFILFITFLLLQFSVSDEQRGPPVLDSDEQEAVYEVLSSINAGIPWRILFPDDLCFSAPHGVVCSYFIDESTTIETARITELSFGYVSDYTPNPPCSANASLNPRIFTSFRYLRKLFFYKCFTGSDVRVPDFSRSIFMNSIEEIVFMENSGLVGSVSEMVGNFRNLRRLVVTGNPIQGSVPDTIGDLVNMEEINLKGNQMEGNVPVEFGKKLKKLKVLDLSDNFLDGNVPESIGSLMGLVKLDLSHNGFSGKIPESLGQLKELELLDLSFNQFGHGGIPLFIAEIPKLKQVHLSGNQLGGHVFENWEKIGGILGIGFSNMGLVGDIPAAMGIHLKNLCFLGLDNNKLQGEVPYEFEGLDSANEINLENNNLSGRVPFSARFAAKLGTKLKLSGNSGICVDQEWVRLESSFRNLKQCNKSHVSNPVPLKQISDAIAPSHSSSSTSSSSWMTSKKKNMSLLRLILMIHIFYHFHSFII